MKANTIWTSDYNPLTPSADNISDEMEQFLEDLFEGVCSKYVERSQCCSICSRNIASESMHCEISDCPHNER